jgi:hypothetical protein
MKSISIKKRVYFIVISIIELQFTFFNYVFGQIITGNNQKVTQIQLSAEEITYQNEKLIKGTLQVANTFCEEKLSIYIQLFNSEIKLLGEKIYKLDKAVNKIDFVFTIYSHESLYVLSAFIPASDTLIAQTFKILLNGSDVKKDIESDYRNTSTIQLFPESGSAIINHYTRFAINVGNTHNLGGNTRLAVRNGQGQLVAKCEIGSDGWGFADIPIFDNEVYVLESNNKEVLGTINIQTDNVVKEKGFALRASLEGNHLIAEMRKAPSDPRQKVSLHVLYQNTLLFEANAYFREDTTVVETMFPLKSLEKKLLKLRLIDETNQSVAERLMDIPSTKQHLSTDLENIFQHIYSTCVNLAEIKEQNISDYLIAVNTETFSTKKEKGFTVHFSSPGLSGQTLNYQILDSLEKTIDIGSVVFDSNNVLRITNQSFSGKAKIIFYLKGNQSLSLIEPIPFPPKESYIQYLRNKLDSLNEYKLTGNNSTNILPNNNAKDSITVLRGVEVTAKKKTRTEELENKYINNGMFLDMNALNIDLENDPYTSNYDIYDYLVRKIPGLSVKVDPTDNRQKIFVYRQGFVEVYLDETFIGSVKDLPFKTLMDIGYIRFIKNPVSSMKSAAGGSMLQKRSYTAGITGTLALYTKKINDNKQKDIKSEYWLQGYDN